MTRSAPGWIVSQPVGLNGNGHGDCHGHNHTYGCDHSHSNGYDNGGDLGGRSPSYYGGGGRAR